MEFRYLSSKFYADYPSNKYPELMHKEKRPYTQTIVALGNLKFAVPLRSNIPHDGNVLWTNKSCRCGLDFTKAVLILDEDYIGDTQVQIRQDEYKKLLGKEHIVQQKMAKCIEDYKKAKKNIHKAHNRQYCSYSTLQYFEEYIYSEV